MATTVAVFMDFANIDRSGRDRGERIDFEHLLDYLVYGKKLIEAFAYVPIDPNAPTSADRKIDHLWRSGYIVKSKVGTPRGDSYKCNMDVELTLDLMNAAYRIKPDVILLAAGDGDYLPAVLAVREMGIRVEVAGFSNTADVLKTQASSYVDLEQYLAELVEDDEELEDDEDLLDEEDQNLANEDVEPESRSMNR